MKKIFGFLMITVLLWSCGSQFNRSKYNRYMWNRSGGKQEKELKSTEEESKTNSQNVFEEKKSEIKPMDNVETSSIQSRKNQEISSDKKAIASVATDKKVTPSPISFTSVTKEKRKPISIEKKFKKPHQNPMQGDDVDAMWIVTLILCFLLPPLGVYLKDGAITGLFWLVLILCLLGGSFLFGVAGFVGGFFGVGIILALLRFFDII